jgi:hypothetical protein
MSNKSGFSMSFVQLIHVNCSVYRRNISLEHFIVKLQFVSPLPEKKCSSVTASFG